VRLLFTFLLVSLLPALRAQAQAPLPFTAATSCGVLGAASETQVRQVITGPGGSTYLTGSFSGTVTFGTYTLKSAGGQDIFVAKRDAAGNYQWLVQAGGDNEDIGASLALDASGNVYFTGNFCSKVAAFGPTTLQQSNTNTHKTYVAKLSPTGQWRWAVQADADYRTLNDLAASLAVDKSGNVYIAGQFDSLQLTLGNTTLTNTSNSDSDLFVAKLNTNGQWLWAVSGGGTGLDFASGVAVDAAGNVYLSAYLEGKTSTLGGTVLTSTGSGTVAVAKLSPTGTWQWLATASGTSSTCPFGIAVDDAGQAYVTGMFNAQTSFGTAVLQAVGGNDIFVARLSAAGTWQWATRGGSTTNEWAQAIALDKAGNSYVAGHFMSAAINLGGTVLTNRSSAYDIFVGKLNAQGDWVGAASAGGGGDDFSQTVALDGQGGVYIGGYSNGLKATFGPFEVPGNTGLTKGASGYVAQLTDNILATQLGQAATPAFTVFPNPSQGLLQVRGLQAGAPVEVRTLTGRVVLTARAPATGPLQLALPASVAPGVYLVHSNGKSSKLFIE